MLCHTLTPEEHLPKNSIIIKCQRSSEQSLGKHEITTMHERQVPSNIAPQNVAATAICKLQDFLMSHSICGAEAQETTTGLKHNDWTQAAQLLKETPEAVPHRVCNASIGIGRWWRTQGGRDEAFALAGGFLAPRHRSPQGPNLQVTFLLHLPLRRCFWWWRLDTSKDRTLNDGPGAMPHSAVGRLFGK